MMERTIYRQVFGHEIMDYGRACYTFACNLLDWLSAVAEDSYLRFYMKSNARRES